MKTTIIKSAFLLIISLITSTYQNQAFSQVASATLVNDCATIDLECTLTTSGTWGCSHSPVIFGGATSATTTADVSGIPPATTITFTWYDDAGWTRNTVITTHSSVITSFSAGTDITECDPLVTDVQLSASLPLGYTGEWSVLDGQTVPNPFTDPTIPDPLVDLQLGFNRFRWTVTNPDGCSNFDDVEVHFAPVYALAHVAGNLVPICDSTVQLEGNIPSDWDIAPSYFASGSWVHLGAGPSSNVAITDPNLYNTTVTRLDPGSNIFEWTIDNGYCTSSSTVDIRNDLPTKPNAGNNTIICDDIYILKANMPLPQRGSGSWDIISGNGVFSDINDPNAQVSDLAYYVPEDQPGFVPTNETINVFEWVITYTDPNDGHECALRDTVEIVNLLPSVPANAGLDQTVCGERVNLNALCHGSGAMFHWWEKIGPDLGEQIYHPRENVLDNTEFNARVWNLQSGATTSFQWIKRNELTRYGYTKECIDRDTVEITSVPFPFEPTAGSDRSICEDTCRMQATSVAALGLDPANVTGEWSTIFTHSPGVTYDNINSPSAFVSGLFYGYNILRWTITDLTNSCSYSDDLYIYNAAPNKVETGNDITTCDGTATVNANEPLIGTGMWSWDPAYAGISINDLACNNDVCNIYVSNMTRGTYTFTWTVTNTFNGEYGMPAKTCQLDDQIQVESKMVTPNAGNDQYVCSDTTSLSGSILDPLSDPWGTTGQWSVVVSSSAPTPPSFSSATTVVTTTNRNPKVYNLSRTQANAFRWTEWNIDGSCPTSDDVVVYNGLPSDAVILDPVTTQHTVCDGSYTLRAQNLSYGEGLWTVDNPTGIVIAANTNLVTNVSGIPQKSNRIFKWTASRTNLNGQACKDSASVNIYNNGITSDPNLPGTVCGDPGGVGNTTLDANGNEPDITGLWTASPSNPGASTIANPTSFTTSVSNLASGNHTFTWTVYRTHSGVQCSDSKNVTFLVSVPDVAQADVYNPTTFEKGDTVETCDDVVQLQGNLPASIATGNGVWTELNGTPSSTLIIADNTNNVSTVSGFIAKDNNNEHGFIWTIKNKEGCSSADTVVVLNHGVIANAHPSTKQNIHICSENYTLQAEDLNVYNSEVAYLVKAFGLWTTTSGAGIVDNTAYDTEVNGLPQGGTINEFKWTVTKGNCISSDIVNVYNDGFTIGAGGPYQACKETTILHGEDPSPGTGSWKALSLGSIISPSSNITVIDNLKLPGDFDFVWTVKRGVCSASATATVTNNTVYPDAGYDQPTCTDSVKLQAVEDLTAIGSWTPVSASALTTIESPSMATTWIKSLRQGVSIFKWTLTKGSCSDYNEVAAINNSVEANASDVIICKLPEQLTALPPTNGATGQWTNLSPSPVNFIDGNTLYNTRIDGIMEGDIALLKWEVSNSYCSDDTTIMTRNNSFKISAGINNDTVCSNTANLSAETRKTGSGYWMVTPSTGWIADPTNAVTSVNNLSQGDNTLRWTYQDNGCTASDEITIRNNELYLLPMAPVTTCDTYTTLTGKSIAGGSGMWDYNPKDYGSVNIISPNSAITLVEGLKGVYSFHTFTWSVTANGCSASSSVDVTTNFFKADAGSPQTVPTDFTALDGYLETGATGTWSQIGTTASIVDPTLKGTMVNNLLFGSNLFKWSVDWKGCNSIDTVNIIYNYLNINAGGDTSICNTRVLLKANDPAPGTGKWTKISGTGEFTDDTDPRTEVTGIEIGSVNWYKWTVSIPGDEITDSVRVINTQFPLTAGIDRDICKNNVTLSGQEIAGATGYWTTDYSGGTPTFIPDNSTYNAQVIDLGPGPNIFKWTVSRPLGCTNSALVQISFNQPPVANFDTDITEGCSPVDVKYSNTSSGAVTYYWDLGDEERTETDLKPFTKTYHALYENDSVYTTKLIAYSSAGCTDTVTKKIKVFKIPKVEFAAYPVIQRYPDNVVNIENLSGKTYDKYYWDYGDETNQIDHEFVDTDEHPYDTWGEYFITLTAESGDCEGKFTQSIEILPPLLKDNGGEHLAGCQTFTAKLRANVEHADTFYWELGDYDATSSLENPIYPYEEAKRYFADLYAGGPGTDGELIFIRRDTIDVYPTPVADFVPAPRTVLLPNQAVHCDNFTSNGDFYVWDFGDDSPTSTESNPIHYYTKPGTYNISLNAYTENECFDDTTFEDAITVLDAGFVKLPSAFTPNRTGPTGGEWNKKDRSNDVFHAVSRGVEEFKLEIFNRWGQKVFESNDVNIGWDGYIDGKLANQDVYVWKIYAKYINGAVLQDSGDVTVLQ